MCRVTDDRDRRSVRVVPTEAGRALREAVLERMEALNAEILRDFTQEQREVLKSCLSRLGSACGEV